MPSVFFPGAVTQRELNQLRNKSAGRNADLQQLAESRLESLSHTLRPFDAGELLLVSYAVPDRERRASDERTPYQLVEVVAATEAKKGRVLSENDEFEVCGFV